MAERLFIANDSGAVRYLGVEYQGREKVHYRGVRENLTPYLKRAELMAQITDTDKNGNIQWNGQVPRIVIHDWLTEQGKNWNEYATDKDLQAQFMLYFNHEFKRMTARHYQERPLAINRATAPKLGAKVLADWRAQA